MAWKQVPLMEKLTREDQEREDAKLDAIRLAIFGTPPPDYQDPWKAGEAA